MDIADIIVSVLQGTILVADRMFDFTLEYPIPSAIVYLLIFLKRRSITRFLTRNLFKALLFRL